MLYLKYRYLKNGDCLTIRYMLATAEELLYGLSVYLVNYELDWQVILPRQFANRAVSAPRSFSVAK